MVAPYKATAARLLASKYSYHIGSWAGQCAANLQNVAIKGAAENPAADPCECIEFGQAVETRIYDAMLAIIDTLAAQPDDAAAGDAKHCEPGDHAWEIISNDEDGVVWRCAFCMKHVHEGRKRKP